MAALDAAQTPSRERLPDSAVPVVGLEVHARLLTRSKLFCSCPNVYGASANSATCPVCLGLPGTLPVLNEQAGVLAARVGLATGCDINPCSVFARKHYFYPDLPRNYQITQYDRPLCANGQLTIAVGGREQIFAITRIHLEEDAGKTSTDGDRFRQVHIDLNRAGTPLAEIVSAPQMSSGDQAHAYLSGLRRLLVWLEVCDGDMSRGSLRCDANVSLRRPDNTCGARTEIKNLNSCRAVRLAVDHEIARQRQLLASGVQPVPETRGWDASRRRTVFMRTKEAAADYRYFPEPDLPPLLVPDRQRALLAAALPELPLACQARLCKQYGIPAASADLLVERPQLAEYFEAVARQTSNGPAAAKWIVTEVLHSLQATGGDIRRFPVAPEHLAELLDLVDCGTISGRQAKEVWQDMVGGQGSPLAIVKKRKLSQNSDESQLLAVVDTVLAESPDLVAAYLGGKTKVMTHLIGMIMEKTGGRANPELTRRLLIQAIKPDNREL